MDRGGFLQRHLDADGPLPRPHVPREAEEFRAALRAHHFKLLGWSPQRTAGELERTEAWVIRCWSMPAASAPRPRCVPTYIADYELRMLQAGVEPFRPPTLIRHYVHDAPDMYSQCATAIPWRQAVVRRRNNQTGELTVTEVASNRQDCVFSGLRTGLAQLDAVLERVCRDFDIEDPGAHLVCNWYPDGRASIGAHSHPFWSAILSFGEPRVFMLDGEPFLLGDGDLLVFGTQKHGVPKMPDVRDGRLSVAIFWFPEHRHASSAQARNGGTLAAGTLGSGDACARCGLHDVLLQEALDGRAYCEACWAESRAFGSRRATDDSATTEDDMLAFALQLSVDEQ